MIMARAPKDYSGELSCSDSILTYRSDAVDWSIALSDIKLMAEYTTAYGPWADDYFLVFVTDPESGWYEASFYATGRNEVVATLEETLSATIRLGLCNSTAWKSRIIWPLHLADKVLIDLVPHKTAFGRFRQKRLGAPVEWVLSDAAKSVFRE